MNKGTEIKKKEKKSSILLIQNLEHSNTQISLLKIAKSDFAKSHFKKQNNLLIIK